MSAAPRELAPPRITATGLSSGLAARYDDPADPTELTLYDPDGDKELTEWLSVDPASAVSLATMR